MGSALIIRQGFFEGRILPGLEQKFYKFVAEQMVPIWRAFPELVELRVSSAIAPEKNLSYPLHTAFTFQSEQSLDLALASRERQEALRRTQTLLKMFDGCIFHVVTRELAYPDLQTQPTGAAERS